MVNILNLEFISKLPNISYYSHKVGVFYDMGDVNAEHQEPNFERRVLNYVNYNDFFLRTQLSWA